MVMDIHEGDGFPLQGNFGQNSKSCFQQKILNFLENIFDMFFKPNVQGTHMTFLCSRNPKILFGIFWSRYSIKNGFFSQTCLVLQK
jgi:hypothetical protein